MNIQLLDPVDEFRHLPPPPTAAAGRHTSCTWWQVPVAFGSHGGGLVHLSFHGAQQCQREVGAVEAGGAHGEALQLSRCGGGWCLVDGAMSGGWERSGDFPSTCLPWLPSCLASPSCHGTSTLVVNLLLLQAMLQEASNQEDLALCEKTFQAQGRSDVDSLEPTPAMA